MRLVFLYRYFLPFSLATGIIVSLSFLSNPKNVESSGSGTSSLSVHPVPFTDPDDTKLSMPAETNVLAIPLKNAGRLFMIEAIIDNQSGNLIFDSGATGLVMNRTYFRKYVKTNVQNSNGITGPVAEVESINLGKVNISGLTFTKIPASLADLGHIENRRGVKVLGLIGFEYLRDFEIVIDASNNELQLHKIDLQGNRVSETAKSFQPDISQPFEVFKNVVFLKGTIGGKILRFCLDTGAETNVKGWQLPVALAPGNYEYKFIVDGDWITDPANPYKTGSDDYSNSFMAFKPNHTFVLENHADATNVNLAGSFNDWSSNSYIMVKKDGKWTISLYLKPGKYTYKFIVDSKWILDPGNEIYEANEYGTNNSVLWIEQ